MNTPEQLTFDVAVDQEEGFRFLVDFGMEGVDLLRTDEPPPLSHGEGPNPARLLAAAVGNCLAASLLFCMREEGAEPTGITAEITGTLSRTARGRLRVGQLDVVLHVDGEGEAARSLESCLGRFEEFCMVTESVRTGMDVMVEVKPRIAEPAAGSPDEKKEPASAV